MKKKWKILCIIAFLIYSSALTTYFFVKTDAEWFVLQASSDFYPCQNQHTGAIEVNTDDIVFVSDINLGVRIFNASNNGIWDELDSMNRPYNYTRSFALTDKYLFLIDYNNLSVIDITNPYNLTEVAVYSTSEYLWDVVIYQSSAIIIGFEMLSVLDITDITDIYITDQYRLPYCEHGLSLWENYLYVANYMQGVAIYQVTEDGRLDYQSKFENYGRPESVYWLVERASRVTASKKYLFILDQYHGLVICNRSDPINPVLLSYRYATSQCLTITFDGRFIIVADYNEGIRIIDLVDPLNPQTIIIEKSQGVCLDVIYINGKIYTLTQNGVGTYQIIPGLGRNPSLVNEAKNVLIGIGGTTVAIVFVIFIVNVVKKSEILE